jgi:formate hydrogenlyase subunit 3/multisubunit Na+/H+ antiporter MnhD subunit
MTALYTGPHDRRRSPWLTMVVGVLGAADALRRAPHPESFHIISQIGYMLVGVALATPLATRRLACSTSSTTSW